MINLQSWNHAGVRVACLVAGFAMALHVNALETVGRYSAERAGPTIVQHDLLTVPISTRFPDSIRTVGQAVEAALMTTGYRLASPLNADLARAALLALPLPAAHREFRHSPLRTVLETLVGPAFKLIEDPAHRLVSFERCGDAFRSNPSSGAPP